MRSGSACGAVGFHSGGETIRFASPSPLRRGYCRSGSVRSGLQSNPQCGLNLSVRARDREYDLNRLPHLLLSHHPRVIVPPPSDCRDPNAWLPTLVLLPSAPESL